MKNFIFGNTVIFQAVYKLYLKCHSKCFRSEIDNENFQEVLRNLIIGVLHGLAFASLASTSLLNVVSLMSFYAAL